MSSVGNAAICSVPFASTTITGSTYLTFDALKGSIDFSHCSSCAISFVSFRLLMSSGRNGLRDMIPAVRFKIRIQNLPSYSIHESGSLQYAYLSLSWTGLKVNCGSLPFANGCGLIIQFLSTMRRGTLVELSLAVGA